MGSLTKGRSMKALRLFPTLCLPPFFLGAPPSSCVHVNGERLKGLLLGLAEFGKNPEVGVTRVAFSREDQAARAWLLDHMKEAGLEVWVDPAANIHGRRAGTDPSLPTIL